MAGADQAGADLVDAGQIQPDGEQQPGHRGDEHRRLELEPPPGRRPRGARRQQGRAENGERHQHAGGVGDGLPRALPRAAPASPTTFNASTGNTHGIRLRISPPRKATPSRRCSLIVGGRGGTVPAAACTATSVSSPLRSRIDRMPDSSFSGAERLARPQPESEPAMPDRQRLRGTVADGAGRVGNEPCVDNGRRESARGLARTASRRCPPPRARATAAAPACRTRRTAAPAPTVTAFPAGRSSRKSASSGTQISRHTSQFACALTSAVPLGRRRDRDRQQHLAGIGVGHQRPFGDTLRRRPRDRPGGGAGRQVRSSSGGTPASPGFCQ